MQTKIAYQPTCIRVTHPPTPIPTPTEALLDRGLPVDVRDDYGSTLLTIASQNGNKRVSKLVMRRGANINARNLRGNTPLHYCHQYGYGDTLGEWFCAVAEVVCSLLSSLVCFGLWFILIILIPTPILNIYLRPYYIPTYLHTCPPIYLPNCLSSYLPTYLHTCTSHYIYIYTPPPHAGQYLVSKGADAFARNNAGKLPAEGI